MTHTWIIRKNLYLLIESEIEFKLKSSVWIIYSNETENIVFSEHWPFGEFCCYSFGYLQVLVVLASSYTLVVISFER